MKQRIALLYGIDDQSREFEVAATRALIAGAESALAGRGWEVATIEVKDDLIGALKPYSPDDWLIFNLCEGSPSQAFYYAKTARILSVMGYIYTGADHVALDATQFKWKMKSVLQQCGVPTPRWVVFEQAADIGPRALSNDFFPAIVKPANEHCSYGITRESVVMDAAEAQAQAERIIAQFNGPVLIEEFLDSAEYNVSVWGSVQPAVLGISTMTYEAFEDVRDRLCTFEAKWDPSSEPYRRIPAVCPAPVSPALKAEIEAVTVAAYTALGCRDYGRIDLRLKDGWPMVLDVNPNCDVSPDGGFAVAAAAAGLSYGEMMEQIALFALERSQQPAYMPARMPVECSVGAWMPQPESVLATP
ncbi:MAG: ATP-grasp domain-containing protein [Anaerolineae bacterium]|nr:ATP-grasp domain-containing protein [Thermoflexales bacterium]MDW8406222.1 ATP-grasp domain-containing protein [Anaerolineae bacterium]